jgi:hypothetical protein
MKFETLARNCLPDSVVLLGLKLKPLSLGHYILLRRLGCGFVSEESTGISFEDVIVGVLVCSMSYSDFVEFAGSDTFREELTNWSKKVEEMIKADPTFNIFECVGSYKSYMERGSEMPKFWDMDEANSRKSGSHWSIVLWQTLMKLGFTNEEVMNMPLSLSFDHFFRYAEQEGAVELMDPATEDMIIESEKTYGKN